MGHDPAATAFFTIAILSAMGALGLAVPAALAPQPGRLAAGAAGCLAASVVLMVLVRDFARGSIWQLAGAQPAMSVAPQWGPIAAFGVLFVAAAATIWWMVAKLAASGKPEAVRKV
jgi:hypothetical protein